MDVIKDAEDVLKEIEREVVRVSRQNPAMNNYTIIRAYDAALIITASLRANNSRSQRT
jgi:hypothetical protein